jgi:hypothetical protein
MPIDKNSIKNLLEFLERKYPDTYESQEQIKSSSINPNELFKLLFFCHEDLLIHSSTIEEHGRIVGFRNIRINSNGINWLLGLKIRPFSNIA